MKNILIILLSLLIASCGTGQTNQKLFVEKAKPDKIIQNPEYLENLIKNIKEDKIKNIHALLIIKDDKLITEEYFSGFNRNELHYTASVSKSFASTLLGIAIDKGYFKGNLKEVLNRNIAELFPEYANIILQDSMKTDLKLEHILTMTAGFEWDEHTLPYSDGRNDCIRINNSDNPMKFLFERKLIHKPGAEFYYNGGLSLSISYLIEKYTKMSVDKFAEKYLFKPLEISNYRWTKVENGLVDTDGGLHLSPIDQAKLGYLFFNKGVWKKQQIVSADWVETASKMHKINKNMPNYGFQWWGGEFATLNQTFGMYMASGHGGQKIVIIPEQKTVIVISQQVFNNPYGDLNFIAIMSDYIIPALINSKIVNKTIQLSEKQLSKLEGHYVIEDKSEFIDFEIVKGSLIGYQRNGEQNMFIPVSNNIFKTRVMDLIDIYIEFIPDSTEEFKSVKSKFAFMHKQYHKTEK